MNVCPECKTKIYNPSASFCYKCGHRISSQSKGVDAPVSDLTSKYKEGTPKQKDMSKDVSPELSVGSRSIGIETPSINKKPLPKSPTLNDPPDKLTKRWNMFILGANALSILFLIVAVGLFFRSNNEISGKNFVPTVTINNVVIEDVVEDVFEMQVLNNDLYSVVPKEAVFYAESTNLTEFMGNYLSSEEVEYLELTYDLTLEDLLVFIKPNYAYFVMDNNNTAVVLQTGGFDFFERTYTKYQENKSENASIYTRRVGEFLIVSRNPALINTMSDIASGTSLGLASDPVFNNSIGSIAGRAFSFIFTKDSQSTEDSLGDQLDIMGLSFLLDEVQKAGTNSVYIVKEGSKYYVKPISN